MLIKQILSCLLFVLFGINMVQAQYNTSTLYGDRSGLSASRYLPASLNIEPYQWQVGFNYHFWAASNSLNFSNLRTIYQEKKVTESDIKAFLDRMDDVNLIGFGQDYQIVSLAYRFKNNDQLTHLNFSIEDRFGGTFRFSKTLMELAWKGNVQFAGQEVSLNPIKLNMLYRREYALGSAFNINDGLLGQKTRIGVRIKYLQGIAGVYMPNNSINLFTEKNGRYIEFDFDYEIKSSGMNQFGLFNKNGQGFGLDLGLSQAISSKVKASIGLTDLGAIHFDKNVSTYSKHRELRYQGLIIDRVFGGNIGQSSVDSLKNLYLPEQAEGGSFWYPIAPRVTAQFNYQLTSSSANQSQQLYATYIQGLRNGALETERPYLSLGYKRHFNQTFMAGGNLSAGGYNDWAMGIFAGVRIGPHFRLTVNSDNIRALLNPQWGTGLDFGFNASWGFF